MYQPASDAFYKEGKNWDSEVSKRTKSLKYHTKKNLEFFLVVPVTLLYDSTG